MAKRAGTDRNAQAVAKRQSAALDYFETEDGRRIQLKKPDLMFIQQTMHDVKMPDKPTYDVKIGSRTVAYPLDPLVIKQTEDPVEKARLRKIWLDYQSELNEATLEQAMRSTGAVYYEGTVPDLEMVDGDRKWLRKVRVARWEIPDDDEEKWVFYLQTSLSEPDTVKISSAIVRKAGGVAEEDIQVAEDMFFDPVSTDARSGDLEDIEPDQE